MGVYNPQRYVHADSFLHPAVTPFLVADPTDLLSTPMATRGRCAHQIPSCGNALATALDQTFDSAVDSDMSYPMYNGGGESLYLLRPLPFTPMSYLFAIYLEPVRTAFELEPNQPEPVRGVQFAVPSHASNRTAGPVHGSASWPAEPDGTELRPP